MSATLSIDGFGPLPVHTPATVTDVCALVKQQRALNQGVYTVGGRTQLDFGLVPAKPGIALDMTALNKVIDYPARDMTITVQAGITLAELQAVLGTEGQWLPLDAPYPERSTLGGLVATNTSGPRRLGYGSLRDFVIGITFISDTGDEIHGGGRVVKNVAGYDLMKLHTGALGTLGIITQLTLKVRPKPEKKTILVTSIIERPVSILLDCLHASRSKPVAVHIHYSQPVLGAEILFEEKAVTVTEQIRTLQKELHAVDLTVNLPTVEDNNERVDDTIRDSTRETINPDCKFMYKVNVKPSRVSELLSQLPRGVLASGEAMNGILWVHSDEPILLPDIGTKIVHRAPAAWKTPERVFGKPTPAFELMRHIKKTLDPDDVFNPGRMFAST